MFPHLVESPALERRLVKLRTVGRLYGEAAGQTLKEAETAVDGCGKDARLLLWT